MSVSQPPVAAPVAFHRVVIFDDLQRGHAQADDVVAALAARQPGMQVFVAFATGIDAAPAEGLSAAAIDHVVAPLAAAVERLRARDIDAHAWTARGTAFDVVLEVIEDVGADLVIIPTAAAHSIVKRVSNSTTGRALRHSAVPVLLLGPSFDPASWAGLAPLVHPVADPYVGSNDPGVAFAAAVALQLGAPLQLVHAYREADDEPDLSPAARADIDASVAGRALSGLVTLAAALAPTPATGVALAGSHVGQTLVRYAQTAGVGMFVMPAFAPGFTHVTVRGSVTDWLLRRAPCPVLVQGHPRQPPADAAVALSQLVYDWLADGDGLG